MCREMEWDRGGRGRPRGGRRRGRGAIRRISKIRSEMGGRRQSGRRRVERIIIMKKNI